jgi:hypothetical protein
VLANGRDLRLDRHRRHHAGVLLASGGLPYFGQVGGSPALIQAA